MPTGDITTGVGAGNSVDNLSDQVVSGISPVTFDADTVRARQGLSNDPSKRYVTEAITYQSYSGTDITAVFMVPGEPKPMILGELQTISYSIHRENSPVRSLGKAGPCGFVKGPRTIAGSLIFTQFSEYAFYRLEQNKYLVSKGLFPLADMLPPFDVVLSFSNEYGSFSKMKILGVSIVDEGGTMSVDDLVTEQTFTYMARGIEPMVAYVPSGFQKEKLANGSLTTKPRNVIDFGV